MFSHNDKFQHKKCKNRKTTIWSFLLSNFRVKAVFYDVTWLWHNCLRCDHVTFECHELFLPCCFTSLFFPVPALSRRTYCSVRAVSHCKPCTLQTVLHCKFDSCPAVWIFFPCHIFCSVLAVSHCICCSLLVVSSHIFNSVLALSCLKFSSILVDSLPLFCSVLALSLFVLLKYFFNAYLILYSCWMMLYRMKCLLTTVPWVLRPLMIL